jgi:predicted component of type VI protein secretion system
MGVILEIRTGVGAGKVIPLKTGESVTVGRAAGKAEFALAEDTFMSGLHFAVECGASGSRVVDRKSSNGTFLNGAKIQNAMLANGDEIKAGKTVFHVKILSDEKISAMDLPQQPSAPPVSRPSRSEPPSSSDAQASSRPPTSEPPQRVPSSVAPERVAEAVPPGRAPEISRPPAEVPLARGDERRPDANAGAHVAPVEEVQPREKPGIIPPEGSASERGMEDAGIVEPRAGFVEERAKSSSPVAAPPLKSERPAPFVERPADRPPSRSAMTPRGFAFSVMGWSFPAAPVDWQIQEGFGLQQSGHEEFPGSVAASEELLGGITLQQFVESQISTLRGYLHDPKIEPTMPPRVGGADESLAMDVRHSTKDGRELVYRRIYARSGSSVGVLTVTTLAADFPQVLQSLQPLLEGAAFHSTVSS